jgi:tetratricopeptide (TPR) repeat protein
MQQELVALEARARDLRKASKFEEAIQILLIIVQREPGWEHGLCHYELAICYESLGKLAEAREFFKKALSYEPRNTIYLGGFAAHLYLHEQSFEAFQAHLDLLRVEVEDCDAHGVKQTKIALATLGKKLGMSDEDMQGRIERIVTSARPQSS